MSILVAVVKDGETAIAADCLCSFGDTQINDMDNHSMAKIIKSGESYIGYTGWGKYENILKHYLTKTLNSSLPSLNSEIEVFEFFSKLWKVMEESYGLVNEQCNRQDDSPFGEMDSSFIVANKTGIYLVSSHIAVSKFSKFCATGSGSEYCYGAFDVLYDLNISASEIAQKSVQIAINYDAHCGGKIELFNV